MDLLEALAGPVARSGVHSQPGPKTDNTIRDAMTTAHAFGRGNRNPKLNRQIARWQTDEGSVKFWRNVFRLVANKKISIDGFIKFLKQNASSHHRQSRKRSHNLTKMLLDGILTERGTTTAFCEDLSLVMRTGNSEDLINCIRRHLHVQGLGTNLVPSVRTVQKSTASMVRQFIALCKPERTYSGFRVDLVASVRIAVFIFYGTSSLDGIRVDIWGDGCEIGGKEVTRLTFRLLNNENGPSAQSSDAVFCFCSYRGKDARFHLEMNIGPTVVGNQESGWLFKQASP